MPCGCSGGTWKPPAQQQQQTGEDDTAKQAPLKRPAATGPAAPGYYHKPS